MLDALLWKLISWLNECFNSECAKSNAGTQVPVHRVPDTDVEIYHALKARAVWVLLGIVCSRHSPWPSSDNTWEPLDDVCFRHSRCDYRFMCYPLTTIDHRLCPPVARKTTPWKSIFCPQWISVSPQLKFVFNSTAHWFVRTSASSENVVPFLESGPCNNNTKITATKSSTVTWTHSNFLQQILSRTCDCRQKHQMSTNCLV